MGDPRGRPGPGARSAPAAALLVKGTEVPLPSGETLIGRGTGCRVSIAGGLISRQHARLSNVGGRVTIEDLGSKNGVFVNGHRLDRPAPLNDGDTLLIGTTELTFFVGPPEDSEPPSTRVCFDEQGNLLSEAAEDLGDEPTGVHLEPVPPAPEQFNRDDITVQGTRPPLPRSTSGLHAREPVPRATQRSMQETQAPERRRPTPPPLELELDFNPPTPASGAIRRSPSQPEPPSSGSGAGTLPSAKLPGLMPIGRVTSSAPPRNASSRVTDPPSQDPFMAVVDVVSRMLSRSDQEAAARTLGAQLPRRIALIQSGHPLDATTLEAAGSCCLELCHAAGDPHWLDMTLELYATARSPMGPNVLERVAGLLGIVPAATRARFVEYQELVRSLLGEVDVAQRQACERILAVRA